jgi:hypothetical protein
MVGRISMMLLVLVLSGCTRVLPLKHDAVVVDYEATRRGTYLFKVGTNPTQYVVISEPPPDIAKEITTSLGLSAESIGQIAGGEAKLEYASKVIDLAKRSQTLQVLREALFRLSEMSLSAQLTTDQRLAMFERVLRTTETLADAELRQQAAAEHDSLRRLVEPLSPEKREELILRHLGEVPTRDMTQDPDAVETTQPSDGVPTRDMTSDD